MPSRSPFLTEKRQRFRPRPPAAGNTRSVAADQIEVLIREAYGLQTENTAPAETQAAPSPKTVFSDPETLLSSFRQDLGVLLPDIGREDCLRLLTKGGKAEKKLPQADLTAFDQKVAAGIVKKYQKLADGQILDHTTFKLSALDLEMIRPVPPGGSWKDIPAQTVQKSKRLMRIAQTGGRTTLYGRIDYARPSYTITTYFNRPGNGTYVHPVHDRVLSVREAARFQCFPDTYFFLGSKRDKLRQIGNAGACRVFADLVKRSAE